LSKPKLFIASPTIGLVHAEYCLSLARTIQHLHGQGIATSYGTIDGSTALAEKRDWLAAHFVQATDATHMLFIDSDMAFDEDLAFRLLGFGKDVIGAICTRRALDLAGYGARIQHGDAPERALALAHEFVFLPEESQQIHVAGDLCRIAGLGAAFMLISRRCIETVSAGADAYVSLNGDTVRGIFARIDRRDARPLSEDYSFCQRWRESGGEVWAYIKAQIWHCGTMRYGVPFERYLAAAYRRQG
jgi:hypothetical protein